MATWALAADPEGARPFPHEHARHPGEDAEIVVVIQPKKAHWPPLTTVPGLVPPLDRTRILTTINIRQKAGRGSVSVGGFRPIIPLALASIRPDRPDTMQP